MLDITQSAKKLTSIITSTKNIIEIDTLLRKYNYIFDAMHYSIICCKVSKMQYDRYYTKKILDHSIKSWLSINNKKIGRGGRNLANILHSLAKINIKLYVDELINEIKYLFQEHLKKI